MVCLREWVGIKPSRAAAFPRIPAHRVVEALEKGRPEGSDESKTRLLAIRLFSTVRHVEGIGHELDSQGELVACHSACSSASTPMLQRLFSSSVAERRSPTACSEVNFAVQGGRRICMMLPEGNSGRV